MMSQALLLVLGGLGALSPIIAQSLSSATPATRTTVTVAGTTLVLPTTLTSSAAARATTAGSGAISAQPILSMSAIQTVTACNTVRLNWQLSNANPSAYSVTFRAHNSDIRQSIPPSSETSRSSAISTAVSTPTSSRPTAVSITPPASRSTASITANVDGIAALYTADTDEDEIPAVETTPPTVGRDSDVIAARNLAALGWADATAPLAKRTILSINQTIGVAPASAPYQWPVDLPEGRYIFTAAIPALDVEYNVLLTVLEGQDTSCLEEYKVASARLIAGSSSTSTSTPTSRSAAATTSGNLAGADAGALASANAGLSAGAIAGIVIGVLALLGLIGALAFCCVRRRRRDRGMSMDPGAGRDMQYAADSSGFATTGPAHQRLSSVGGAVSTGSHTHGSPLSTDSHTFHPNAHINTSASGLAAGAGAGATGSTAATTAALALARARSERGSVSSLGSRDSAREYPEAQTPQTAGSLEGENPFATPGLSKSEKRQSDPLGYAPSAFGSFTPTATARAAAVSGTDSDERAFRRASSPVFGYAPSAYTALPPARSTSGRTPTSSSTPSSSRRPSPRGSIADASSSAAAAAAAGVMPRKGSMKRKPVPSLGPELRRQIGVVEGGAGRSSGPGERGGVRQKEFRLVPDLPPAAAAGH